VDSGTDLASTAVQVERVSSLSDLWEPGQCLAASWHAALRRVECGWRTPEDGVSVEDRST